MKKYFSTAQLIVSLFVTLTLIPSLFANVYAENTLTIESYTQLANNIHAVRFLLDRRSVEILGKFSSVLCFDEGNVKRETAPADNTGVIIEIPSQQGGRGGSDYFPWPIGIDAETERQLKGDDISGGDWDVIEALYFSDPQSIFLLKSFELCG